MQPTRSDRDRPVFVTGGTGFIGAYLLRGLLSQGYTKIRALRRPESPMDLVEDFQDRIEWVEGSVTDVGKLDEYLQGQSWVIHAAALVSFDPRDRKRMRLVNVSGTANLVNLSLHHGVDKLLHLSSIASLGRPEERNVIDEEVKWERSENRNQYAISKYQSEMEVWRGMAEGLPVAIVNPSVVLGSGFWQRGTPRFFRMLSGGYPFYPTGGTGFVDVRDVADFSLKLLESPIQDRRFILNGDNWSYANLFRSISEELQAPLPRFRVPPWVGEWLWRLEWLRSRLTGAQPLLTRESARAAQETWVFDNQRSRTELDFTYRPLHQTIRETASQWQEAKTEEEKPMLLPE